MFNLSSTPMEFRSRRMPIRPVEGQQVLIRVCKEIKLWQGSQRVSYRAGDVYAGTVTLVSEDGLLDLDLVGGQMMRIHTRDVAFAIEPYAG